MKTHWAHNITYSLQHNLLILLHRTTSQAKCCERKRRRRGEEVKTRKKKWNSARGKACIYTWRCTKKKMQKTKWTNHFRWIHAIHWLLYVHVHTAGYSFLFYFDKCSTFATSFAYFFSSLFGFSLELKLCMYKAHLQKLILYS